jgi:putative ABC transport system ATP-binding protein
MSAGLHADAITLVREGRRILDAVTLHVDRGEMVAVTGPSGAGKTSLLSVLGGLIEADEGSASWAGAPVVRGTTHPAHPTGFVPQGYALLPLLTAFENVELPLQIAGLPRAEIADRARVALDAAGLGEDELQADRLVEELSGGQQQRVAVARALVVDPILLLADEPTSELDAVTRDRVLAGLRARAASGAAVLMATHDQEAAQACDRVLELSGGALRGGHAS